MSTTVEPAPTFHGHELQPGDRVQARNGHGVISQLTLSRWGTSHGGHIWLAGCDVRNTNSRTVFLADVTRVTRGGKTL